MSFCKECGNKLDDEVRFCPQCGTEQVVKTVPPQEEPAATPIQEPVSKQPVYPQQGYQQPMNQQQGYQQPGYEQPKLKKKKSKKALVAVLVAVLLVAGAFGFVMLTPFALGLKNKINMNIQSSEKYYISLEKQNSEVTIKRLGNSYEKYINTFSSKEGITIDFDLSVGASQSFLENYGLPTSLTEVALTTSQAYQSGKGYAGEAGLHVSGQKLVDLLAFFDTSSNQLLAQVPQLSNEYLYMDLTELMEEFTSNMDLSQFDKLKELKLSNEELQELLTKYTDILVEGASDVEREKNVTLEVGESKGKYTKITSIINEEDAINIAIAMLKEAKNDKTIIKFVEAFQVSKEDYKDQMEEILKELEDNKEALSSDQELVVELYVDSNGTIVGRNISFSGDSEGEFQAGYYVIKNKDSLDFEFFFESDGTILKASTSAEIKNDKYTGELVFSIDSYGFENEFKIDYRDVKQVEKNGQVYTLGTFEFDLSAFIAANSKIRVECTETDKKQNIKVIYVDNDEEAIWLQIGYLIKNSAKVEIPKVDINNAYNMMDEYEMQEYIINADTMGLLEPIQDIVEDYTNMFSFGGLGDIDYDDDIDDPWVYEDDGEIEVPIDNYDALYAYSQDDLIGEWILEESGEYFIFTNDNLVYRYRDETMDPDNSFIGSYSTNAPAYNQEYDLIPGLDISVDFYECWIDGEDMGYQYFNFELVPTETGFALINFETQDTFTFTKIN